MKIGIVGDIHWSRYSSILRQRGDKYSVRLENCIKSINWAEKLFEQVKCDNVVYLGDFFDSSELNSEEITAIKDIEWNCIEHHFLVGNHEMGINDLSYSSSHLFNYIHMGANSSISYIEDKPITSIYNDIDLVYIPYILEENRKPLIEYMTDNSHKKIVFSHNDIAGIQMGKFISKNGFTIEEIKNNCDLFINGHLHNGAKVDDGIINVGNLTGQNFSEDAFTYDHCAMILDTDTMRIEVYENPYAINFYKIDTTTQKFNIEELKNNAIVTIKTTQEEQYKYKQILDDSDKVITSRLIIAPSDNTNTTNNCKEILAVNHLDKFSEYVLNTLGTSDVVKQELGEVLS